MFKRPSAREVKRGVKLFRRLVDLANGGQARGISYKGFVERVYGVSFAELHGGRQWLPSDTSDAVRLANQITTDAGGRRDVCRGKITIKAGMDTFIWRNEPPHVRPPDAWKASLPYSRTDWLGVFPEGARRLIDEENDG